MPILYTTRGSATGGRAGHGASENGRSRCDADGSEGTGRRWRHRHHPEQLFSVGYSACFLGALKFVAGQAKVKIPDDAKVTATVGIGPREDGGGFGIEVSLSVNLPGIDRAVAEDLVAKAHIVCPYSHAMRTSTEVPVTVE